MLVELTRWEALIAAHVGCLRTVESIFNGNRNKAGCKPEDAYKVSILGAQGEAAVAKALNLYCPPSVNAFKRVADLPFDIEVRCRSYSNAELIVRDDDPSDRNYVLVTGTGPKFDVKGWLPGGECKNPEWYYSPNDRPKCFWVPASALRPITELPMDGRVIDQ